MCTVSCLFVAVHLLSESSSNPTLDPNASLKECLNQAIACNIIDQKDLTWNAEVLLFYEKARYGAGVGLLVRCLYISLMHIPNANF